MACACASSSHWTNLLSFRGSPAAPRLARAASHRHIAVHGFSDVMTLRTISRTGPCASTLSGSSFPWARMVTHMRSNFARKLRRCAARKLRCEIRWSASYAAFLVEVVAGQIAPSIREFVQGPFFLHLRSPGAHSATISSGHASLPKRSLSVGAGLGGSVGGAGRSNWYGRRSWLIPPPMRVRGGPVVSVSRSAAPPSRMRGWSVSANEGASRHPRRHGKRPVCTTSQAMMPKRPTSARGSKEAARRDAGIR